MKKVFAFVAVIAAVCAVSCKKGDTPASKPVDATITAADVTVEVGSTVRVNATTNSTATISYVQDNSGVYSVDAAGVVTGVKAGEGQLVIKVPAVEGKFTAAEMTIKVSVTDAGGFNPPAEAAIKIDGDFSDWAALKQGSFSQTYGDEDATHPALTHCKVYADAENIYVYVEWDTDMIVYEKDVEHVPFHCYINTDNNENTGGYGTEFADADIDVLLEGALYDGGVMGSYDPSAFSYAGEPGTTEWAWDDLGIEETFCAGAGIDGKYELSISRAALSAAGFTVADIFTIGFDIQQNWDSVGILPNAAPSEENPSGVVNTLQVTTQK